MLEATAKFNEMSWQRTSTSFSSKSSWVSPEEELDWKIRPEANTIRWIVGHLRWFEDWVPDVTENKGRYGEDKVPLAYDFDDLDEFLQGFDKEG